MATDEELTKSLMIESQIWLTDDVEDDEVVLDRARRRHTTALQAARAHQSHVPKRRGYQLELSAYCRLSH